MTTKIQLNKCRINNEILIKARSQGFVNLICLYGYVDLICLSSSSNFLNCLS